MCDTSANVFLTWPCGPDSACYAKCTDSCKSQFIGTRKIFRGPYTKILPANASQSSGAALSHSEYLRGRYLSKQCIPPNMNNQHFPPNVNNNGCNKTYMTQAAAMAAGLYNNN